LDQKLWSAAAEELEERTIDDPWLEVLTDTIGELNGKISSADAWLIVGVRTEHRSQDQNKRFGAAMKTLGFERPRSKLRFDGKKQWGYVRGTEEERELRIHVYQEGMGRDNYTCSHQTWQEKQKADLENTATDEAMRRKLREAVGRN
jgi:hypothetical protein